MVHRHMIVAGIGGISCCYCELIQLFCCKWDSALESAVVYASESDLQMTKTDIASFLINTV